MFYDREKEQKEILSTLKQKPGVIQILYGPINSGKTNLITEIIANLPKEIHTFYTNLRNKEECQEKMDFLFQVGEKGNINFKTKQMIELVNFWVENNVLFLDPVKKIVKPQSQLIFRGIKELMKNKV